MSVDRRSEIVGAGERRMEEVRMAGVEKRSFDSPDESRTPDKTRADVVHIGGATAARLTLEPGWSWAECVKPVVGGDSCQLSHLGVLQSGTMRITHEDGTVVEIGPGETYVIEPGHQAEVVGDEPVVGYEFQSQTAEQYARA
jgi:hypothetical protein